MMPTHAAVMQIEINVYTEYIFCKLLEIEMVGGGVNRCTNNFWAPSIGFRSLPRSAAGRRSGLLRCLGLCCADLPRTLESVSAIVSQE